MKSNTLLRFGSMTAATAMTLCPEGLHAQQREQTRPNIIFILTDDQRADALGFAGNQFIQTPNLDRLAKEGAYFQKAFVTTPISAASRASILTGMYERSHGYTFQKGALAPPYMEIMYPMMLRRNGYYTGFFGKLGVEARNFESYFDQAETYDRMDRFPDRRGYFYKTIGRDTVHLTRYTGHQGIEFIRNAPTDRPFLLSLCFSAPHAHDSAPDQYFVQSKTENRYQGVVFPPPVMAEDAYFEQLPREVREGFNRTRWHWRYDTPEKYQHSMRGYYGMISEIDDEVGELCRQLHKQGVDRNTIIIYMGDNGYYTGERQLAGKWLMHDLSLQVPLIIYDPRVERHQRIDRMVLNIDIAPTILELAGVEIPPAYQGEELTAAVNRGVEKTDRKAILFEHLWNIPQIPSSEAIRTDRWKYFRYRAIVAPEELYDLKNDPMEKQNLAQNPRYLSVLKKLRAEMDQQIALRGSQRLCPDPTEAVTQTK